jgi:hypothetical protein
VLSINKSNNDEEVRHKRVQLSGCAGEEIGTGLTRAVPRMARRRSRPVALSVWFVVHGSHEDDAEVDVLRRLLLRKECVVPTAHWFVAAEQDSTSRFSAACLSNMGCGSVIRRAWRHRSVRRRSARVAVQLRMTQACLAVEEVDHVLRPVQLLNRAPRADLARERGDGLTVAPALPACHVAVARQHRDDD